MPRPRELVLASRTPDFYDVLGVPRTADEATIRRAYKDLAFRHHPDKNLDKPEEASLQFKLVAEAYSVLKDPQKKAAYDSGERLASPRADFDFTAMTLEKAKAMFLDVFGEQFADNMVKCVTPIAQVAEQAFFAGVLPAFKATGGHLKQVAEAAGNTTMAKGSVGYMLKLGTKECAAAVANAELQLELCRHEIQKEIQKLTDHRQAIRFMLNKREEERARRGWWQQVVDIATREREEMEGREDEAAARITKRLQKNVREAKAVQEHYFRELLSAKEAQAQAYDEERLVKQGVSLANLVNASSYLLSGLLSIPSRTSSITMGRV